MESELRYESPVGGNSWMEWMTQSRNKTLLEREIRRWAEAMISQAARK